MRRSGPVARENNPLESASSRRSNLESDSARDRSNETATTASGRSPRRTWIASFNSPTILPISLFHLLRRLERMLAEEVQHLKRPGLGPLRVIHHAYHRAYR